MRSRAPYTPCKLFYDSLVRIEEGDYLKTRAGSAYRILRVRESKAHMCRNNLDCERWPADEIPPDAMVHDLVWYPRKRRAVTLDELAQRRA
ncbi:MAG: hypothetical protein ABI859_16875 [Pseudomonadota bacterium]